MKKAFLFAFFLFSVMLTASAQHKVSIKLLDGSVHNYQTSDIAEILFDEDDQDESDGPKVPYIHAVDLGLSVKWADMNVGAEKPEDYGGYYAWAGLKETEVYDWKACRYSRNDGTTMLKYCTNRDQGTCDYKKHLDPEDDVAFVNLGSGWHIPADDEWAELREKCKWTWSQRNGVYGRTITGPNGNSIFLPAAGFRSENSLIDAGEGGYYWTNTLSEDDSYHAYDFYFNSIGIYCEFDSRYVGLSIRAVCP